MNIFFNIFSTAFNPLITKFFKIVKESKKVFKIPYNIAQDVFLVNTQLFLFSYDLKYMFIFKIYVKSTI